MGDACDDFQLALCSPLFDNRVMVIIRRKHIGDTQRCFLNVAMLNEKDLTEIVYGVRLCIALLTGKATDLLSSESDLRCCKQSSAFQIWSAKTAVSVCIHNWIIATGLTVSGVLVGDPSGSFYFTNILENTVIMLCAFTVLVCTCLYVSLGYVILRANLIRKNMGIGKGELEYLLCAVLTFAPLILELIRSIQEKYDYNSAKLSLSIAKKA
ncbi:hypothetical protein GCK32_006793 [Trichostrongylus colubriformis]|uniref:Uncharacterized protein n=1 Tax=Trichostrongylus colubriformis TaxID=6319 RepID=A0AAN8FCJ1_TRICO